MTTPTRHNTEYDDMTAYRRRWGRHTDDQLRVAAARDPLAFVADHIELADRKPGTIAVYAILDDRPTNVIISDVPADLHEYERRTTIRSTIERLTMAEPFPDWLESRYEYIGYDEAVGRVEELGLVLHRPGSNRPTPSDELWARVLVEECLPEGIDPVGVAVRVPSGDIVRVPMPPDRE